MLLVSIFLPMVMAILLMITKPSQVIRRILTLGASLLCCGCTIASAVAHTEITLFTLLDGVSVQFHTDEVGGFFAILVSVVWVLVTLYSFLYVEHEGAENRYYAFHMLSLGAMIALCCAKNLVTMYFFFECATLFSMPMVLHSLKKEAVSAALKYLFYSIGGALLGLFGIFVMWNYGGTSFAPGGALSAESVAANEPLVLAATLASIVGFGAKAGMYPLHGWLPSAHPVAPAPASALLSGIIAKAGIIAIIRMVYFTVGTDILRGSYVQIVWMILATITVMMGSTMAYRENILKKRLAWSTVSNVSYIMLALSCLSVQGLAGGLMHTLAHALAKTTLFLAAGTIILKEGKHQVSELCGIGKRMPITMWCFTLASLSLIGIPPMIGFSSKWYIAEAAIMGDLNAFSIIIPIVLLVSALLTAGYLLKPIIAAFFPGKDSAGGQERTEAASSMTIPMIVLCSIGVICGIFGQGVFDYILGIANSCI